MPNSYVYFFIACSTPGLSIHYQRGQFEGEQQLFRLTLNVLIAIVFLTTPVSAAGMFKFTPVQGVSVSDLRVSGENGAVRLGDYKGQWLVLNLWATWCAPCVQELPSLSALSERLPKSKFRVMVVSVDKGGIPVARQFLDRLGLRSVEAYADPEETVFPVSTYGPDLRL